MCPEKQSSETARCEQHMPISSFWTIAVVRKRTQKTTPLLRNSPGVNLLVSRQQDQGGDKKQLQQKQTQEVSMGLGVLSKLGFPERLPVPRAFPEWGMWRCWHLLEASDRFPTTSE